MSRVMGNPNEIRVVNIRMVREPSLYSETPVSTPQDVMEVIAKEFATYDREVFGVLNLKSNGQIINMNWNADKKAYTAETLSDDLPYGTYTIRESKTNDTYQRTDKTEHMFEVRADGTIYSYDDGSNEAPLTFDNYVYRSDVQGTKIGDGDSRDHSYEADAG